MKGKSYEIIIINSTRKKQKFTIVQNILSKINKKNYVIEQRGLRIHQFKIEKNNYSVKIISNLYLARPIIFEYEKNFFDVFHA